MSNLAKFDRTTAANEIRDLIADLDQRIMRQQKRIEKALLERDLARDLQSTLDEMIRSREFMQSQVDRFESEGGI